MAEVYSSLFKGNAHITTPFSKSHPAIDMGNYKTRNRIYSPARFGRGKVTRQTDNYTYGGVNYKNVLTQWVQYDSGFETCMVHGHINDRVLKVGDIVEAGQLVYITGNMGYSKGDHLHIQLKKGGVLVDPTPYVTNDYSSFKVGDKIEVTAWQNIRKGSSTKYEITGKTAVGEVYEIEDGPRFADGYTWWDLKNQNWVADVNKFKIYTPPSTPPTTPPTTPSNPPISDDLVKKVEELSKEVEGLKTALRTAEELVKKQVADIKVLTERESYVEGLKKGLEEENKELFEQVEKLEKVKEQLQSDKENLQYELSECKLELTEGHNGFLRKSLEWVANLLKRLFKKS